MVKDCKAPGGPADPDYDKVWEAYRKRKVAAIARGKMPSLFATSGKNGGDHQKGAFPKGKGKGKGKGKADGRLGRGNGAQGGFGSARAAVDDDQPQDDQEQPAEAKAAVEGDTFRASAAGHTHKFPVGAIGLDSWANVHLTHERGRPNAYPHTLSLAHGIVSVGEKLGRREYLDV